MRLHELLTPLTLCVLGAINGLLIGLVTEEMRLVYMANSMRLAMREAPLREDYIADFFYPTRASLIPFVSIVAFTAVSHLLHRYFIGRHARLLLTWLLLFVFAVSAGYFMEPKRVVSISIASVISVALISALIYRLWINHPESIPARWVVIGISAALLVGAITQLIGLFMVQSQEIRNPLTWLLWFIVVIVINTIYGVLVHFAFPQYFRIEPHLSSS